MTPQVKKSRMSPLKSVAKPKPRLIRYDAPSSRLCTLNIYVSMQSNTKSKTSKAGKKSASATLLVGNKNTGKAAGRSVTAASKDKLGKDVRPLCLALYLLDTITTASRS